MVMIIMSQPSLITSRIPLVINLQKLLAWFSKLSTNIKNHMILSKYYYQRNHFGYSRVMALNLQKLLDKLFVRALTSLSFDQSSPNFLQMLKIIVSQPSLITSGIPWVTWESRPLIYRNYLINCLSTLKHPLNNPLQSFYKCWKS